MTLQASQTKEGAQPTGSLFSEVPGPLLWVGCLGHRAAPSALQQVMFSGGSFAFQGKLSAVQRYLGCYNEGRGYGI